MMKANNNIEDKNRINSVIQMNIANDCYLNLNTNEEYKFIPLFCTSFFPEKAQEYEILVQQTYNTIRQVGRPRTIKSLLDNLFGERNYTDKSSDIDINIKRTIIGFDCDLSYKNDDEISFNTLLLIKKENTGYDLIKIQVYTNPISINSNKSINIVFPYCHNIYIDPQEREDAKNKIISNAKKTIDKIKKSNDENSKEDDK